ncbi:hypothetical protein F4811DRAFT_495067 [Daldinia bambusicola]|nr:hypothetical protein F4811DRAFT_495067 [Daldinia bambusicola]
MEAVATSLPIDGADDTSTSASDDVQSRLREAIQNDDYKEVERLLNYREDLLEASLDCNPFDESDVTKAPKVAPLALAASLNRTSIVKLFLDRHANANAKDPVYGESALHLAARNGQKDSVDLLLSRGADIDQCNCNKASPLFLACKYGHSEIAISLLEAHADISKRDEYGNTPFLMACFENRLETMRLLLERGSKEQLNDKNDLLNGSLHMSCYHNNGYEAASWLIKLGVPVDQLGQKGQTPLYLACEQGNIETIKLLISQGADVHKRNANGASPIMTSCYMGQLRSVETLMLHGAMVSDLDNSRNTCFHQVVWGASNFSEDRKRILEILINAGININQPNRAHRTPLSMACEKQMDDSIRCLLDLGADINYKAAPDGSTPLMVACRKPNTDTIKKLLELEPDTEIVNKNGRTALSLACRFGQLGNAKALISQGAAVTVHDKYGYTPLYIAIKCSHFDIALEILATPIYFPQNIAQDKAFTDSRAHAQEIENLLLKSFEKAKYEEEELRRILYWAIANGAFGLAHHCVSQNPQLLQWERNGATWLHAAALYGQHEFIQLSGEMPLNKVDVLATAEDGSTAFHVAAIEGNVKAVESLLNMIPEKSTKVEAIITQNNQGESPLAISINRRHKSLEELFWDIISQLGTADKNFVQNNPEKASKILELLAIYETPGNEVVLHQLLRQWYPDKSPINQKDLTTLQLAVYCSQAVVVWWLLSKGGYSDHVENALEFALGQGVDDGVGSYIKGLLLHPPPILTRVANPNNDRITSPPTLMNKEDPALNIQGNIIDIYSQGERLSIPYAKSSIKNIVYEKGPETLMAKARENLDLDALKRRLGRSNPDSHQEDDAESDIPMGEGEPQNATIAEKDQRNVDQNDEDFGGATGDLKLRWIHLPVNDLQIMRDLVCRLSHDSKRMAMDHAALMKHFNHSWTELAAGGKRNYMKPQFIRKELDYADRLNDNRNESRPTGENSVCTAIYMPYLTLGTYPRVSSDQGIENPERSGESARNCNYRRIRHKSMTLDQYYYPTIYDTDERDNDQILSKFLKEKDELGHKKILLVNQLWMWIIDEKTIITATTEDSEHTNSLFQNIQDNILYGETRSRFERATSVRSIMELFLGAATGFFIEKFISCPGQESGQRINKGPIEIFRESIRKVADDETRLFRDFLAGLHNEARQQGVLHSEESWLNSRARQVSRNRYHIISSETELLDMIRDIRDELHILKSLAEDQHVVWKQAFHNTGRSDQFQYYHSCTPTDVKKNVDDMLLEAEKTTNYINDLLDLRQAEYNRIQANDSAKQSNSIFIFTVVTIVFLPLSFLTSLFALDVTSFPHESGELKYQGWWLFPILFGVTAAVSIPAIILAWNVNAISERLRTRDKQTSSLTEKPTISNGNHALAQKVTENVSGGRLRRRWRNRGKEFLPQYEGP